MVDVGRRSIAVSKRLKTFSKAEKQQYYKLCAVASERLAVQGLPDLNLDQCECICDTIARKEMLTWGQIRKLAFPEKMEKETSRDLGLFD